MENALLRAFCKINLSLKLGRRRSDGYHEIDTVMQTVSLHDEIIFRPTDGPSKMDISGLSGGISVSSDNLVMRALEKIKSVCGIERCFNISLIKKTPSAAGLGGGSSDAASVICLFGRMAGLEDCELSQISAGLGSDIPFFCFGGRCRCSGRGEDVEPLEDITEKTVLILMPDFGISTAEAYSLWDRFIENNPDYFHKGGNDFEKAIFPSYPFLPKIKDRLFELGASYASMSGSGSAMFGIFDSDSLFERACSDVFLNSSGNIFKAVTIGRKRFLEEGVSLCSFRPL
ncbi:MAG: 4-(cytidine 5'-diphospho)-2-C-methyl-D-erythritol kinase [bacterium]|nr:4-(cytidine 5'-diphospho)-2-C-methyl-D-erythritol kinase [bacterium]